MHRNMAIITKSYKYMYIYYAYLKSVLCIRRHELDFKRPGRPQDRSTHQLLHPIPIWYNDHIKRIWLLNGL